MEESSQDYCDKVRSDGCCPHCGEEITDLQEYGLPDGDEFQCDHCEKFYTVRTSVVYYLRQSKRKAI